MTRLKIIPTKYLSHYKKEQPISILKRFNKLKVRPTYQNFGYSVKQASVFSSMIEGNEIDFDSYLKYEATGMNANSKSFKEIRNLTEGYAFASTHALNIKNMFKAHELLSATHISQKKYRGKIRDKEVYVFGNGQIVYTGATVKKVSKELDKLFEDIAVLRTRTLSIAEIFYYASLIHLILVKIHPFADGNGRISRLVEKWFLVDKLGKNAWFINSEKLYQTRIKSYYKNVDIGKTYETLNFDLCIPFLKMLPMSFRMK